MSIRRGSGSEEELLCPSASEEVFHYNQAGGTPPTTSYPASLATAFSSVWRGVRRIASPLSLAMANHEIPSGLKDKKVNKAEDQLESSQGGKLNGLHWITTAAFIVADIAGGGVVAMPIALLNAGGFFGSIVIAVVCASFCYTAHLLGCNWMTMCRRWPDQYGSEHCRKPYPEMAFRSMGEGARQFTSFILNIMFFGVSIVYLLLSSKIISDFLASALDITVGQCVMLLLVAAALWPVTMFKSPQDFWWAVVTAMVTTAISVLLILMGIWLDYDYCAPVASYPTYQLDHLLLSLGIFMFSFGGHSVFPTIQHDMKYPQKFTKSSILAFAVVFVMYIPITVVGYMVYGDSLKDSIIMSIQSPYIQQAANLFIAVHCILTLTIVINPLNQELEHILRIPHHFGWKRILLRSTTLLAIVFFAETIPSFGPILNLIGGTTVAFTSAILPCLFYLYLHAQEKKAGESKRKTGHSKHRIPTFKQIVERTPQTVLAINIFVIVVAVVCGIATTQSAIVELATSSFSVPCYLTSPSTNLNIASHVVHCCGPDQNVSRYGSSSFCPAIA